MPQESTIGAALEQDHREIDARFASFAEGVAAGRVEAEQLQAASDGLRRHIWVEEELHFPPLRAAGLLGPLLVMLREHGQIWDLLDRLEAQVSDHDDPAAMHQTYGLLESILGEHNAKEEVIVYPAGDERLTGDVVASIRTALTTGEPPPGWTCEMAGRG